MNAELAQALLIDRAVMSRLTSASPAAIRPGGCSLEPAGAMYATWGRLPSRRSS
jgi:hypothetical protein